MKKANLHEAKTQLSKLVELARRDEEVIICKAGTPVAKLIPIKEKKTKRTPGGWEGRVGIHPDFDKLPDSFLKKFT